MTRVRDKYWKDSGKPQFDLLSGERETIAPICPLRLLRFVLSVREKPVLFEEVSTGVVPDVSFGYTMCQQLLD